MSVSSLVDPVPDLSDCDDSTTVLSDSDAALPCCNCDDSLASLGDMQELEHDFIGLKSLQVASITSDFLSPPDFHEFATLSSSGTSSCL